MIREARKNFILAQNYKSWIEIINSPGRSSSFIPTDRQTHSVSRSCQPVQIVHEQQICSSDFAVFLLILHFRIIYCTLHAHLHLLPLPGLFRHPHNHFVLFRLIFFISQFLFVGHFHFTFILKSLGFLIALFQPPQLRPSYRLPFGRGRRAMESMRAHFATIRVRSFCSATFWLQFHLVSHLLWPDCIYGGSYSLVAKLVML